MIDVALVASQAVLFAAQTLATLFMYAAGLIGALVTALLAILFLVDLFDS